MAAPVMYPQWPRRGHQARQDGRRYRRVVARFCDVKTRHLMAVLVCGRVVRDGSAKGATSLVCPDVACPGEQAV